MLAWKWVNICHKGWKTQAAIWLLQVPQANGGETAKTKTTNIYRYGDQSPYKMEIATSTKTDNLKTSTWRSAAVNDAKDANKSHALVIKVSYVV